ncbi:MAG: VOC family protein [Thermoanaerobaculia bacterium]
MTDLLANVDVDDLEKAVAFYGRGLGLTVGRRFGTGAVEMLGASCPLYLLVKPQGSPAGVEGGPVRDYRRHWTPVHLDFVVTDLESAVRRAELAGAALEGEIRTQAWGRMANLADPFGHGFCLLEFRGRGYDEVADGGTSHSGQEE